MNRNWHSERLGISWATVSIAALLVATPVNAQEPMGPENPAAAVEETVAGER